jgi:hypothetical protein
MPQALLTRLQQAIAALEFSVAQTPPTPHPIRPSPEMRSWRGRRLAQAKQRVATVILASGHLTGAPAAIGHTIGARLTQIYALAGTLRKIDQHRSRALAVLRAVTMR